MLVSDKSANILLNALRCSLRGIEFGFDEPIDAAEWYRLFHIAEEHRVLPLFTDAVYDSKALKEYPKLQKRFIDAATAETITQARRTGEFLEFFRDLLSRGLRPVVQKGIICRSIYPVPDQRGSVDEDLLIEPDDFRKYADAMAELGLKRIDINTDQTMESAYKDDSRGLYIELHCSAFSEDSEAYGDCNAPFNGALERAVSIEYMGTELLTLSPSDHLLYLILHAYKHFLHGGFGIRQVMDICLFAQRYADEIGFDGVLGWLLKLKLERFSAAIFRIGEKHFEIPMPEAFAKFDDDECPLLNDILTGGLYGVADVNRMHSVTLTLDAAAASKHGQHRSVLGSVFRPAKELAGRYPYLRRRPWLLPVAWVQRVHGYLVKRKKQSSVDPAESIRIGKERIGLMRQYGIIDRE